MDKASFKLTIFVKYALNGTNKAEIEDQLRFAAGFLAGEGFLSGNSKATVSTWSEKVKEV